MKTSCDGVDSEILPRLSLRVYLSLRVCSRSTYHLISLGSLQRGAGPVSIEERREIRCRRFVLANCHFCGRSPQGFTGSGCIGLYGHFWLRLQFFILDFLQPYHAYGHSSGRLVLEDLVQRLHEHGNVVDLETVTLVLYDPHQLHVELPDRRYWVHWLAWLDRQEASESQVRYVKHQVRFVTKVDVALAIASFTFCIARVCETCREALKPRNRIHVQWGVQRLNVSTGLWEPDPEELSRRLAAMTRALP